MNGENNYNNTTSPMSRNTFYNMEAPEWRCENCGRFNHREARFCRSCGAPGPITAMRVNDMHVAEMPQKKSSAGKWIAIIAAVVIVIAAITFTVIKFVLPKDDLSNTASTNNQIEASTETESTAKTDASAESLENNSTVNVNDTITSQEQDIYNDQETTVYSHYVVGGTYYVQPDDGVNVRVGPGTNYDIVINQDTGKKVALRQGTAVVCEGMSEDNNWMMISSGWICVYDGNETLVK